MKPANDPDVDYKALVQQGYDCCAAAYDKSRQEEATPALALVIDQLQDGASVLDIGCGAGVPIAQALAKRFAVTGVDISGEMIQRAQSNVPEATFVHGDIMSLAFPTAHFDAVVAFYSIFHLPRQEHPELLRRVHRWLKPGGYLMATVSAFSEAPYTENDFFGETMYWSNYGLYDYVEILKSIGFTVLETGVVGHGYQEEQPHPDEQHPIIFAQKAPSEQVA